MPAATVLTTVIRLLSRREHSRAELEEKLTRRGYDAAEIAACLQEVQEKTLLSDARFCAAYIRQYGGQYGDFRLRAELKKRGVEAREITAALTAAALAPEEMRALAVIRKKYPRGIAPGQHQTAQRFLMQRGFAGNTIGAALAACGSGSSSENDE